jgi:hypothetical protein
VVSQQLERDRQEYGNQVVVCRQNSVRQQVQAINAGAGTDPFAINPGP